MKPASGQSCSKDLRTGLLLRNWKKVPYEVTVECFDKWQIYHYKIPLAKVGMVQAPGRAPRGRPKMNWRKCVQDVMGENGRIEVDARDRER